VDEFHWVKSKGRLSCEKDKLHAAALLMLLCGTALAANEEVHRCYSFSYAYDDEYHWEVCDHSGTVKGEKWSHTNSCTNIGTCANCGMTGLTNEITHHWKDREYDEKNCWLVCKNFGFEDVHVRHFFPCDDELPARCQRCKQPCEITHLWGERLDYIHGNCVEGDISVMKCSICGIVETVVRESTGECEYEFVNQGDTHVYMCKGCGTIEWTDKHVVPCTGGTTCVDGGAEGVTGQVATRLLMAGTMMMRSAGSTVPTAMPMLLRIPIGISAMPQQLASTAAPPM